MKDLLEKRNPTRPAGVAGGEYLGMTRQVSGVLCVLGDVEHIGTVKTPVDYHTVSRKLPDRADQNNECQSGEP